MENRELVDHLRAWVHAGATPKELGGGILHKDFSYQDGIFHVEAPFAAEHARMGDQRLENITVLADVVAADDYVIVARGRDDITWLWRQVAWVFTLRDTFVLRLLITHSAPLSPRLLDGTLPLREI